MCQSVFVPRGVDVPNLDRDREWEYTPSNIKVGDMISAGDVVGTIRENGLFRNHHVMVPPNVTGGRVKKVMPKGSYKIEVAVVEIEECGKTTPVQLFQKWPVRQARPTVEKLQGNSALLTCERVIDALFPVTQGGTAAVPGAFGCGKTVISQALSKYSNSDVVVYVGCGERGNEMAEVLTDFHPLILLIHIGGHPSQGWIDQYGFAHPTSFKYQGTSRKYILVVRRGVASCIFGLCSFIRVISLE